VTLQETARELSGKRPRAEQSISEVGVVTLADQQRSRATSRPPAETALFVGPFLKQFSEEYHGLSDTPAERKFGAPRERTPTGTIAAAHCADPAGATAQQDTDAQIAVQPRPTERQTSTWMLQ
jgi:hypothetical protein